MYVSFLQVEGTPIDIESRTIQAILPYIDGTGIPASLIVTTAGDREAVAGTPAANVALTPESGDYVNLPLVEAISGPLPVWGMDARIRATGTIPVLEAIDVEGLACTSIRYLGSPGVDTVVQGTPAAVASAISPSAPFGGLPVVQALILADGSMPFSTNVGGVVHVGGSGDYDVTLGGPATGGFVTPGLALFGAPVATPLFLSWTSTGPGAFTVFIRDGAGLPVDAAFTIGGLAFV